MRTHGQICVRTQILHICIYAKFAYVCKSGHVYTALDETMSTGPIVFFYYFFLLLKELFFSCQLQKVSQFVYFKAKILGTFKRIRIEIV